MANNGRMLSFQEALTLSKKSERTLRRWIRSGKMPVTYVATEKGREIRVSKEMLEKLLDTGDITQVINGRHIVSAPPAVSERLEQATYRIGWLESQVSHLTKALTEGDTYRQQREDELRKRSEEIGQIVLEKASLETELVRARQEKEALAARVKELERPWWQRLFGLR